MTGEHSGRREKEGGRKRDDKGGAERRREEEKEGICSRVSEGGRLLYFFL